jgi:DNA polymerase III psi subunit
LKSVEDHFDVATFVTFIAPFCIKNIFAKKQKQLPTAKETKQMDQVEKVKIPVSLLSALYKDVLIDASMPTAAKEKKAMRAVIVAAPSNDTIEKEAHELLNGILTACKLDNSNSAVLNTDKENATDLQFIKEHYVTSNIILFGIATAAFGLPINFPPFQIQKVDNIQFVASPSLEEMIGDKSLKVKLWNCLKQIFIA